MKSQTLLLILFFCIGVFSQQKKEAAPPAIKVIARAQQGKILLRWAIDNPVAWQRANTYGYTIERFTVYRDGKRLEKPEQKILTSIPIKPAPLASWEEIALADNNAAILAQAIYGDDFEVGTQEGELMAIVNKVQQLEQRFSFALFAADMNFKAAKLAGLGYEDTTVKNNEGYLYRLKSAIPETLAKVKEGTVYIEASKIEPLPAPIDLVGVFKDKEVLLTWDYELFKSIYTTYHVERSQDGTNFTRLGNLPLVNLNNKEESPTRRMYYIDTLAQNNTTYYYRVLGVSAFGEEGQPSKAIHGQGQKALTATPFITNHKLRGATEAEIYWDFPKEKEMEVAEFQLRGATKDKGKYTVLKKGIPPHIRTSQIKTPYATNYIKVIAMGKDSTETASFAALVQHIDSIPPSRPIGLQGRIDSLGIATITWQPNTEKDLLGYRVFRGNTQNEEYAQITIDPIKNNQFVDTVKVKSLNDKVYYTLVAVDQRYNNSEYSEVLTLKKPDVIPPSSPIFKAYKVTKSGVALSWINSTSPDVVKHELYRKNKSTSGTWQLVWETNDGSTDYEDTKVTSATQFTYKIQAVDDSGLASNDSPTLTVETAANTDEKMVKGLGFKIDRVQNSITLYWRKLPENIKELIIYKSNQESTPVTWQQLPASITEITDKNISPSNVYRYQIRPVFADGSYGALEVLKVNY